VELGEDPDTLVETLGPGKRQLVEIAKALKGNPRIIAFDEPTTSLTEKESVSLFRIIRRLRDKGTAVIYISHNLGDILRICDRVVVLRDGEVAADQPSAEFDISRMIQLMIGRSLEAQFPRRTPPASKEPVLAAKELSYPGVIESVSFQLHRGELLGISGLMGSGRTELARILFGLDPVQSGELLIEGVPVHSLSPKKSIDRGMAFLTEDRKEEGLLTEASIEENLTLASLEKFAGSLSGILDSAHLHREAADLSKRMSIDSRNVRTQLVKTLSGGNQQKVVFGKWFMKGAKILILDEPTRGVDVGARFEIYQMIIDRLEQGAAVILISSDLEELLGLCDRILVMSKGEIHADIPREQFNRQEILRRALGKERLQ
jgi:ABC-type sugar transport system ATPase subunit